MDFFQQEMLIAALLGRNRVPGNESWLALNRPAGKVRDRDAFATHLGHLAIIQEEHAAGVIEQGRNIGGHKAFFFSEPDHNRRGIFGRQGASQGLARSGQPGRTNRKDAAGRPGSPQRRSGPLAGIGRSGGQ